MWRVASEAYAYTAGHPFLTDTVLHNRKTDNDRQIINKQHTAGEINRITNQHKKKNKKQKKTARIVVVCVPIKYAIINQQRMDYQLQYLIN